MSSFANSLLRTLLGPLGFIASNGAFLLNKIDGGNRSNWIDSLFNGEDLTNASNAAQSLFNAETQAGPTGRDLWVAEREDTLNQRTVEDMQKAGLNTALMYGSSGNQPSINTSSSGSTTGLSDLLQLAMLPMQMQAMKAEIGKTNAETKNISQRTLTEEQETALKALMVEFYPQLKSTEIDSMIASVNVAYSQVNVNEANTDLIHNQSEAQSIINDYLNRRQQAELDKIVAEKDKIEEQKKFYHFHALFEKVQYEFARDNKFLMSSSDTLMLAVYLANLIGLDTQSLKTFFTEKLPEVAKQIDKDIFKPDNPLVTIP